MDARSDRIARRLEPILITATLLVVPVLILQGSDVGEPWSSIAVVADWLIWLAFVAELVIMLAVVPHRRRWLAEHPLDVAIVVLTPPFASALLQSLRLLRLLHLLRLLRLATVARAAFSLMGVKYAALLAALTTVVGGQAFATAENVSSGDGLYWSLTTMTTVGYGDVAPDTTSGKILAIVVMLVGIGFVAILTGAIAQRFIAPKEHAVKSGEQELHAKLDTLVKRLDRLRPARSGASRSAERVAKSRAVAERLKAARRATRRAGGSRSWARGARPPSSRADDAHAPGPARVPVRRPARNTVAPSRANVRAAAPPIDPPPP